MEQYWRSPHAFTGDKEIKNCIGPSLDSNPSMFLTTTPKIYTNFNFVVGNLVVKFYKDQPKNIQIIIWKPSQQVSADNINGLLISQSGKWNGAETDKKFPNPLNTTAA